MSYTVAPALTSSSTIHQSFFLILPLAKVRCGVPFIYIPLRDEHIAFRSSGVGPVPFLRYHIFPAHGGVKVNPEVGLFCSSSPTPLHHSPESYQRILEGEPIYMGLPGWGCTPSPAPPVSQYFFYGGAPAANPRLAPLCTPDTAPAASAAPCMLVRTPLSVSHTRPLTCRQMCVRYGTKCSLSSVNLSEERP